MTLDGHNGKIQCISYIANSVFIVSGRSDKTIRVWNYQNGQCINTLEGHTDDILSVASIPGTKLIVSGSKDKTVRIWDYETK